MGALKLRDLTTRHHTARVEIAETCLSVRVDVHYKFMFTCTAGSII